LIERGGDNTFLLIFADGDLPAGTDTRALSAYIITVQQGLSMRARDGGSRAELMRTADLAMAAWPK